MFSFPASAAIHTDQWPSWGWTGQDVTQEYSCVSSLHLHADTNCDSCAQSHSSSHQPPPWLVRAFLLRSKARSGRAQTALEPWHWASLQGMVGREVESIGEHIHLPRDLMQNCPIQAQLRQNLTPTLSYLCPHPVVLK